MAPTGERRRRARMALHCPVRLARIGDVRTVESRTENLSSQGFYCVSDEAFAPGDRLECVLALPGAVFGYGESPFRLHCRARVMRVEQRQPESGFGLACRIEHFTLFPRSD